MSHRQLLLGQAGTVLLAVVLAGVIVRGRVRHWYSFAVSLFVSLAHAALVSFWPETFHDRKVWTAKEILLLVVRMAMVVELTIRVFRGFPGAMATARRIVVLILVITFVLAVASKQDSSDYQGFVGDLMPRLLNGVIWLFTSLAVLILWYRLPVHWFPKAVLLSYVPYLLTFTVALNALGDLGWQSAAWVDQASVVAYVVLLLYWAYAAWRPEPIRPSAGTPDARLPAA